MTAGGPHALRLKSVGLVVTSLAALGGGVARLVDSQDETPRSLTWIETLAPLHVLGWVWVCIGVLGLVALFARVLRGPVFGAAAALHFAWGFSYLVGWAVFDVRRGWVFAAVYLVIAALIVIVAAIREGEPWAD